MQRRHSCRQAGIVNEFCLWIPKTKSVKKSGGSWKKKEWRFFLLSMAGGLLETDYDSAIDFAVTPNEIISTHRESGRPEGII